MILAQIDVWLYSGLGDIRPGARGSLVVEPKVVGDPARVRTGYETPRGTARSAWTRTGSRFALDVTIPDTTTAEVWLPTRAESVPQRATFARTDGGHVYAVPSGRFVFTARTS